MLLGVWSSGFWPGLVDADGGGFGPGAGPFRPDGADVEAEEVTDGEAGEVDADGAVGGDGEGFPGDGIGIGDIRDELIFVEGGIVHAAPAGLRSCLPPGKNLKPAPPACWPPRQASAALAAASPPAVPAPVFRSRAPHPAPPRSLQKDSAAHRDNNSPAHSSHCWKAPPPATPSEATPRTPGIAHDSPP